MPKRTPLKWKEKITRVGGYVSGSTKEFMEEDIINGMKEGDIITTALKNHYLDRKIKAGLSNKKNS